MINKTIIIIIKIMEKFIPMKIVLTAFIILKKKQKKRIYNPKTKKKYI